MKSITIALVALFSFNASANLITETFADGSSLGDWIVDRCAPSSFSIVNNELQMSINGNEQDKCGADPFYATQGMKRILSPSTFVSIDVFLDTENWLIEERLGGFWATTYNSSDAISFYPIIEYIFNGGAITAQTWNGNDGWWDQGNDLLSDNAFNTFSFEIVDGFIQYAINGTHVLTSNTGGHAYFGDVILNARNDGNDFTVRYDNLTYGTISVPETPTLIVMLTGLILLGSRRLV